MTVHLSALKTLSYFDLFDYPITEEEIWLFMDQKVSAENLSEALKQLAEESMIFRLDEFYSIRNNPFLAQRRKKGNKHAADLLPKAYKICGFLYKFPFVRGIGISGSLSKNFAAEDADIDYFVVTKANRLWIARTLMHFYKKLTFLFGREHMYCMNYYVDEEGMNIEEKNAFTAIEVLTLVPVCGNGTMEKFYVSNEWTGGYYPNFVVDAESRRNRKEGWLKRSMEFLLNNNMGDKLDNYLMKLTTKRWNAKEKAERKNEKGHRVGLRTGKHYSKPNPEFFQYPILERYERKLLEIEEFYRPSTSLGVNSDRKEII
ncbi:MAG TPA: hypothetical protein VJT83_04695 [Chitinophagaceae bacterium]|nr:hypothetical protein [Chitinophagaceae bacterium]